MPSDRKTRTPFNRDTNRNRSITRIHVAKRELAQSDDDYRFMLEAITGKDSLRAMTLAELCAVEAHQKSLGFRVKTRRTGPGRRTSPRSQHKASYDKTPVDKLRSLWIDMGREGLIRDGSENGLEAWVQRMSARHNQGRGIEKVDWLHRKEHVCQQLIESLKQWRKRIKENNNAE